MSNIWQHDWFVWAIALALGFPTVTIVLGEIIERLQRRGSPLEATLRIVRNLVLPILAFLLFLESVLELDAGGNGVKIVETLFWVCIIHASLSLIDAALFAKAGANTWRSRVPKLLLDLARLFLVLLGTAIVLATVWKADLAGLATALGVSSIVIGLALQDTLGSIMSGIALLFERPFAVGDWLEVGEIVGQVIDINWRAVRLMTREREMIVIPHQVIGGEIVRNYSQPMRLHVESLTVGFSYNDPPNVVKRVLQGIAIATPDILTKPAPEVRTLSYNDFSITYEVRFHISDYQNLPQIRERFMTRVWYAAQRNKLTIPFPIRTVYHFHGPSTQTDNTSQQFTESIKSIPVFVPLTREQENLEDLAEGAVLLHFGVGEAIIHQGDPGKALYIIVVGRAAVTVTNDLGEEQKIVTLSRGDFFGEISLFTGKPSTATVTAIEDLQVIAIYSDVANMMLENQPSLAREIGQIIDKRRQAIRLATQEDLPSSE